jgi:hypothetical protein
MLSSLGLEFEGQPHSGLDDAKNIARIIIRLISDRAVLRVNERIVSGENHNDDHSSVRLRNVAAVNSKDSQAWLRRQKQALLLSRNK